MRNFVALVPSNKLFVTYNVNAEYETSKDEVIGDVIEALAAAFEAPVTQVRKVFHLYISLGLGAFSSRLTVSEESVVFNLAEFFLGINSSEDLLSGGSSRAFCYHNLNNGRSVVWSHIVI